MKGEEPKRIGGGGRRRAALLVAAVMSLQAGCATAPPGRPDYQEGLGRVAVVAVGSMPEIRFEGFARSKGEGALAGAGAAFGNCASVLGHGSCSGSSCGAAALFWLGVCSVAGAVGGIVGAAEAPSATAVGSAEAKLAARIDPAVVQDSLRDQVVAAGRRRGLEIAAAAGSAAPHGQPDYRPLAVLGFDTVLETALVRVGSRGSGIDEPVSAYMEARVRLLHAAGNSEVFAAEYAHLGDGRRLEEWAANGGAPLLSALESGFAGLGEHLADQVFLLYPFPDQGPHGAGLLAAAFGLAPVSPPTRGTLSGDRIIGDYFEWTAVDSLRPTLRWEAFPREGDRRVAPEEMARVRSVRYDLVIAREHKLTAAEVVYRREGLTAPSHVLEQPLQAGSRYFWTVRARFELDGRERVTEWGVTHYGARGRFTAPSRFSYRFRTPAGAQTAEPMP